MLRFRRYRVCRQLMVLSSIFLIFFSLSICLSHKVSATTSTLTISIADTIELDAMPSTNGSFAASTATNNISVKTNNGTGYDLGIKASTNNSNALNRTGGGSIPSITSSITEEAFRTSTAYNDKWGYKPSKINSSANSNYLQAPTSSSTATRLDKTTTANPSTNNNYTITIGTRVTNSLPSGSYSNTFVLVVVSNPAVYSITYNANGGSDTVTNMPSNVVNQETYSDTVNISNTVPARDGYSFKGWCTAQVADGGTCTGTTYNPDGGGTNLAWTIDQTQSSNSLTLYAMWAAAGIDLYNTVAGMSKGTQTLANMQAAITTSNSGVYAYDASTFGTASDAATTSTIYYYRGILDNTIGTYGSDGDNAAWPNTVLLDTTSNGKDTTDTCWRIVRTTGSGGVKMIYQGKWTGSTCANSSTSANAVSSIYFNRRSTSSTNNYDTKGRIIYVGYNYSSTSSHQTGTSSVNNSTLFVNGTKSNLRTQLESWYNSNMTAWTSKLETSAGWCNDRTTYNDSYTSQTSTVPYRTSSATVYFGANKRNARSGQNEKLSLTCPNTTGNDLLTTTNGLGVPAAPLTADEAALAGSGYYTSDQTTASTYSSNWSSYSFLRSGDAFWLLSPYSRYSVGNVYGFFLNSVGYMNSSGVSFAFGVRPSISLKPGSIAIGGSGTAADPWIVNPPTMQEFSASDCSVMSTGDTFTLLDARDGEKYTIGKLADNNCWMTTNLNLAGGTALSANDTDVTNEYIGSFTTSNNLTKNGNTIVLPASTTSSGFNVDNYSYVANSGNFSNDCSNDLGCYSYYSWDAATLGSGRAITTDNTDAEQSICPKGWHLPNTRTGTDNTSDFRRLVNSLGGSSGTSTYNSSTSPTGSTLSSTLRASPNNFLIAKGYIYGGFMESGSYGTYWTSTAHPNIEYSRTFRIVSSSVYAADDNWTYMGYPVRCVLNN